MGDVEAGSQDQGQAPLEVVFTIADRYLAADGESRTAILVEANDADGEPYEGELLVSKPAPRRAEWTHRSFNLLAVWHKRTTWHVEREGRFVPNT